MRLCGWCSDSRRSEWENRVTAGESVSIVARDTPFSIPAAYRHLRTHAASTAKAEILGSQTLRLSDFVDRQLALAEQAAEVREYGIETSQPKLVLSAAQVESGILSQIIGRLGIDSTDTLELVKDSEALTRAIGTLIATGQIDRDLVQLIGEELRSLGSVRFANALRAMTQTVSLQLTKEST